MILIILYIFFLYFESQKKEVNLAPEDKLDNEKINSNIIKDVNYTSKDSNGNEFIINAAEGEIDLSNTDIIFLKDVKATIRMKNKNEIKIISDFGKYNILNYDTIFNQNVVAVYLDNKITSEYLDFSLSRNSMIITRDVIFTNTENTLKADVVEMNIETKDTKIFMFDNKEKVNIQNN